MGQNPLGDHDDDAPDNGNGHGGREPSLELPSLRLPGLGRKRRDRSVGSPTEPTGNGTAAADHKRVTRVEEPPAAVSSGVTADPETDAEHRAPRPPRLSGPAAAAATGAAVGLTGTLLTYVSMLSCELVGGTGSCGGPGLFLLVAILTGMVLLGSFLLRRLGVVEPASTSFLGVGVVAVVVLLLLLDVVFSAWMFVVIPALGAGAYALAHWVTTRFDD